MIALLAVLGLLESALPALRSRRRIAAGAAGGLLAGLRRRFAAEPPRTRAAAMLLRVLLLAAIALLAAAGLGRGDTAAALAAVAGLAALFAFAGVLRRPARGADLAASLIAGPLAPLFALLPPAQSLPRHVPRDPEETIADLADALASESAERQGMIEALLELERRTVEDIMVPRSEIEGIDASGEWDDILARLRRTPHTRMPLYDGELDRVQGIVHMRLVANELAGGRLTRERLIGIAARREALFAPEGTTLYDQLLRFRRLRRRIAFVVDEYGELRGLVTLEDILEEVVGEFTTQAADPQVRITPRPDGSVIAPGAASLRDLNRALGSQFPTDGPRTLSGLIVEQLESIPQAGAVLSIGGHRIEVLQVADNAVRTARIWPRAAGA